MLLNFYTVNIILGYAVLLFLFVTLGVNNLWLYRKIRLSGISWQYLTSSVTRSIGLVLMMSYFHHVTFYPWLGIPPEQYFFNRLGLILFLIGSSAYVSRANNRKGRA